MQEKLHFPLFQFTSTGTTSGALSRARSVVAALFGPPEERSFTVRYWDQSEEPPGIRGDAPFTLWFKRPGALRRMLLPPSELAIAEAFINDDVDIEGNAEYAMHLGDIIGQRMQSLSGFTGLLPLLMALPGDGIAERDKALDDLRFSGTITRRRGGADAIQHHYDVGNDFYKLWLDERMVYTCAYFTSYDESLDDAQAGKLDLICRKLRLEPGLKLLDIGCGWGALLMHAAANYGVDATGITLSAAQAELARERIADAGLTAHCRVELLDYRDLSRSEQYDRVASVGMMEHVGYDRLPGYFEAAYGALKPGGVFLNHTIVRDGHRERETPAVKIKAKLWRRDQFIHRYIFPDGRLVPVARVVDCAESAGFELRDAEALREHYAMTLRQWLRRLEANEGDAIKLVGEKRYRTWRLYMLAAIASFRAGSTNIVQMLLTKSGADGSAGLPLTRRYMM
jgi:cyclopropane-fatty-acyl-phospholipid synthase